MSQPTDPKHALGVDISVWQDQNSTPQMFDPYKARAMGASFVGIKVSQANWADPDFLMNWSHCRNVLYRLPYHFLTWDVSPKTQAETFWSLLEKDLYGVLPLHCDFEWWKVVPTKAMDILYNFDYRMSQLCGDLPRGMYSADAFWREFGSKADYWKQLNLWLCDIEGAVQVPLPWTKWDFHQYTFKLDGLAWGAESKDLDGDEYNGTLAQMIERYHLPELDGLEPPVTPEEPPMAKYTSNAIGLYTTKAGWTNTAFDFVVGFAGGNWTQKAANYWELAPNENLKAIEEQAHKEGKPFLALWDFDVSDYSLNQIKATEETWRSEADDYPLHALIEALKNRDVDGLIIRVMNRYNRNGGKEMMKYVAFAARKFVERANKWLYTHKGIDKWCFVLTNDNFLRTKEDDGTGPQEDFYAWTKNWWLGIEQEAAVPLALNAWPNDTDSIKAVPPSLGWKLWYHYNTKTLDMMIWNGTKDQMYSFIGYQAGTVEPPPVVVPPPTTTDPTLAALAAKVDALAAEVAEIKATLAKVKEAL